MMPCPWSVGDCPHPKACHCADAIELTASDILAYERYKERSDFDYWHRFSK